MRHEKTSDLGRDPCRAEAEYFDFIDSDAWSHEELKRRLTH